MDSMYSGRSGTLPPASAAPAPVATLPTWPSPLIDAIGTLLTPSSPLGGVPGLRRHLEAAGLRHLVDAWLAGRDTRPMTPDMLAALLPAPAIEHGAQLAQRPVPEFCAELAQSLPLALALMAAAGAPLHGDWPDATARLRALFGA